jgi:hypothetical protein
MYQRGSVCDWLSAEGHATPERSHVIRTLGLVAVNNAENVEAVIEDVNGQTFVVRLRL